MDTKPEFVSTKKCNKCSETKTFSLFIKNKNICKDCNNKLRREKYKNDPKHRENLIKKATDFKKGKILKKQEDKYLRDLSIGLENQECLYCFEIKLKNRFRKNRRKCIDCEREDPVEKCKRYIRTRIYNCLLHRKSQSSIEYLGCCGTEYIEWISNYNPIYNLDNYGEIWHVDHVIPISTFNMDSKEDQMIAFNWRNTMPLSKEENLSKNNKIIKSQVLGHFDALKKYHSKKNIDFPIIFKNLFAKHLDAGNSLES